MCVVMRSLTEKGECTVLTGQKDILKMSVVATQTSVYSQPRVLTDKLERS